MAEIQTQPIGDQQASVDRAGVLRHPDLADGTISDHYPVWVTFRPKFHPALAQLVEFAPALIIRDTRY